MVRNAIFAILLCAGLINLYPLIGIISADRLEQLYGVTLGQPDLAILMRHRAVLLGLLGAFIVTAAFKPSFQIIACIAGLISMVTFTILAFAADNYGPALGKVVVADIVASIGLVTVLLLRSLTK